MPFEVKEYIIYFGDETKEQAARQARVYLEYQEKLAKMSWRWIKALAPVTYIILFIIPVTPVAYVRTYVRTYVRCYVRTYPVIP